MIESPGASAARSAWRNTLTNRRRTIVALILALSLSLNTVSAHAVPGSKLEQARAVKAQVETLDRRAEMAADDYGEAAQKAAKLEKQRKQASAKLKKVTKRMGVVQGHLNDRARSMYRKGPMGFIDVLLGAESFEEFATTWDILHDLNVSDSEAVAELKVLRKQARETKNAIAAKEKAAKKQKAIMASRQASADAALAEKQNKLRGLEAEIAALQAAEERAREAARSSWVRGPEKQFPPPTRAARSEVVSIAKRYLGAPYRWAADGPNSFDCSGFTMFVYRQVGVSLPHSSRAQIHYGERVSRGNLEPGDLVFFGSPIHHVGIYVGGGRYIHAPSSGDVVKISSLSRSDYAGACRP